MADPSKGKSSPDPKNPIAFLTAIFFFNMISRLGFAPLLPAMEADLAISHGQAGGLFFFISSGYCISLFCSIFLTPKFSHRSLIIASSIAVGLSLIFISSGRGLVQLQAGMVFLGLAGGVYLPSGIASLTGLVGRENWGKVLGFHQLAPNLAYILAPLTAGVFLSGSSWRTLPAGYGLAALTLGLGYAVWGRGFEGHTEPPRLKALWDLIQTPAILIIAVLFILGMGLNQGVFAVMPLYLTVERGLDPDWSNYILALSRAVIFGFPLAGGWLADRFGVLRVMTLALACAALGSALLVTLPDSWLWAALIVQAGAGVCVFPLCFALMSMVTGPGNRSVAVSVVVPLAHFLGSGMVPMGVGLLAEAGRFDMGFLGLGIITLLSLPLVRLFKKPS